MGNTSSQENSRYNQQSELSPSLTKATKEHNKDSPNITSTTESRPHCTVHPLLNPTEAQIKSTPISTPTKIMAQDNDLNTISSEVSPRSSFIENSNENSLSTQDVTMSGTGASNVNLVSEPSAMNVDSEGLSSEDPSTQGRPGPPRRRSTLILTDDTDLEKLKLTKINDSAITDSTEDAVAQMEKVESTYEDHSQDPQDSNKNTVPVEIHWFQGGENVFITGSFTGWRKMIKLVKEAENKFTIKLRLPVGTHRFRFIVDNELRFSDYLPTATDQMGNFVNYIEIQSPESSQTTVESQQHQEYPTEETQVPESGHRDSNLGLTNDDDDMGNGYTRFHEEAPAKAELKYVKDIPAIFTDPSVMEQYYVTLDNNQNQNQNQSWLTPPQLPPHLESVILNNYSAADKSNSSGALPIPNHVVLNHLATTSIKHNTLAVASVVRYKRKYVTQVLYAPLQ